MYFLLKNNYVVNEKELDDDLLLNDFGSMANDSFLCRILKCYNLELDYDLNNRQLIIKDLVNNEILEEKDVYHFSGKDITIEKRGCLSENLIFDIKRKSGLNVSIKFWLKNSRKNKECDNETHLRFQNQKVIKSYDKLLEREDSKYGACSIKDNATKETFYYDTSDLNYFKFDSGHFYVDYCVRSQQYCIQIDDGHRKITYQHSNGNLVSTMTHNNQIINDSSSIDEQLGSFTDIIKPFISIIKDDLADLVFLQKKSRLEYLSQLETELLKDQENYMTQLYGINSRIGNIQQEILGIKQNLNETGKSYTKKPNN